MSEVTEQTYSVTLEKKSPTSKFGVAFRNGDDGSVIVQNISKDSVAADSQLKEGYKIISINGQDVTGMTAKAAANLMVKAPSGPLSIVASHCDEEMGIDESSSLIPKEENNLLDDGKIAQSMSGTLGLVILMVQLIAVIVVWVKFGYSSVDKFTTEKYIIFRDIMVMLLLGFGYCKSKNMVDQLSNLLEYSNPPTSL